MQILNLATLALLVGSAVAIPTPHGHVLHEKRARSSQWQKRSRAAPGTTLPVRIGISQPDIHLGHDLLMEISNPKSKKYGQYLSAEEVGDMFRPKKESLKTVSDWLHNSGIESSRHNISAGRGWVKFEASVDELESLLYTQYHVYQHSESKEEHLGCDEYHIPESVRGHIDFITPTVSMAVVETKEMKRKRATAAKEKRSTTTNEKRATATGKSSGSLPVVVTPANLNPHALTEIACHVAVTPECLRTLYGIPLGNSSQPGNEIGIFEDGDFYNQNDLDLTFANLAPYVPNGTHPTLNGIDGGVAPYEDYIGIESLLDMSLIFPLIHPQAAVLYQVDDLKEVESTSGFGDTFLDALDASYCTFEGGDDPTLDPHYPDTGPSPSNEPYLPNGTYGETEMCGAYTPTNVISVSYGLGENAFSYFYENRQCQEYMKLGLQGVSVIYASGDSGVSNRGQCITPAGTTNYSISGAFSPSFPASCPYVTSVGATQFNSDDKSETAVGVPDEDYYSGGGFSNYWPTPDWQEATLRTYFENTPPPYTTTGYGTPVYNKSGRGYPDVAAIGLNILLYVQGEPDFVSGTSASAPIFASIITLINEQRLAAGKGTVGFLNPTLYANPGAFTDITTGDNPGCGTNGFNAVSGWDPVTGLGTPIFPKLLDVFLALP